MNNLVNKNIKHLSYYIILIGVISITALLWSLYLSRPHSSQTDYPVLPEVESSVSFRKLVSFESLVKSSDLIVEGTIIDILTKETISMMPIGDSPEASIQNKIEAQTGQKSTRAPVEQYPVKIRINTILKGSSETQEIIMLRSSLLISSEPELTTNMRMVFFLNEKSTEEAYIIVLPHEGYFYISEDQRVYPAEMTDAVKSTSGMRLDSFKRKVIDLN